MCFAMTLAEKIGPEPDAVRPWLSIVGVGEDGIEGLNATARELIASASIVFGGKRHLALAAPLIRGAARPWPIPFDRTLTEVLAYRDRAVCVLASGDPFCHGVGSLLARHVSRDETIVVPAPSAFSLAASRMLWSLPHTTSLSLCGRPLDLIRPHLHSGARVLALSSDESTPALLARLLRESGFGLSELTVLESLGGPSERVRSARANAFDLEEIGALNVIALEIVADSGARIIPRAAGLADELFEHDGQITKHEVRAVTLSALAPRRGDRLWDVGAGSGSVAIEWMLSDASLSAIAVEARSDRAARIKRNAAHFGVPHLELIEGTAPQALEGLAPPDAVFIGGGASTPGLIEAAQTALRPGGRLVVNAVSLETESVLLSHHSRSGGSLTRIEISHASPIGSQEGRMMGWRSAMPIVQWRWAKS
jgi:precorrin-6Y C5,15-methyltransferase (decarboxylating)